LDRGSQVLQKGNEVDSVSLLIWAKRWLIWCGRGKFGQMIADRDRRERPMQGSTMTRGRFHHYTMGSLLQEVKETKLHFTEATVSHHFGFPTSEYGAEFRPFSSSSREISDGGIGQTKIDVAEHFGDGFLHCSCKKKDLPWVVFGRDSIPFQRPLSEDALQCKKSEQNKIRGSL
jgi:hypothetical protein